MSTDLGIENLLQDQEWFPDWQTWWRNEARETGYIDETGIQMN